MQCVGEAYEKLRGPEYHKLKYSCFQKTGCLKTADDLNDGENGNITDTNDEDLDIDHGSDYDLNHSLVGHEIKALYDNGWFTGAITRFNSGMQKVHVMKMLLVLKSA